MTETWGGGYAWTERLAREMNEGAMTDKSDSDLLNLSVPVHLCRFYADTNGCWLWTGGVDDKGYGDAGYGRPERKAHRAMYALAFGAIPEGHHVHHKCEVKRCVNPDHLEALPLVTHLREHRRAEVELSDETRAAIREAARDPQTTQQQIADRFGVPRPTVNKILQGYSWFDGERVEVERPPCRECGERITTGRRHKVFCSGTCRHRYNSRAGYRRRNNATPDDEGRS